MNEIKLAKQKHKDFDNLTLLKKYEILKGINKHIIYEEVKWYYQGLDEITNQNKIYHGYKRIKKAERIKYSGVPITKINGKTSRFSNKGYIRLIEDVIVLNNKALDVFKADVLSIKAKEVLDYINKIKKELGISNREFPRSNINLIIPRLREEGDVELIKNMLYYRYTSWKGTEYQQYLRPSTLFNSTKFHNYIEEYEQNKSKVEIRQSKLV